MPNVKRNWGINEAGSFESSRAVTPASEGNEVEEVKNGERPKKSVLHEELRIYLWVRLSADEVVRFSCTVLRSTWPIGAQVMRRAFTTTR